MGSDARIYFQAAEGFEPPPLPPRYSIVEYDVDREDDECPDANWLVDYNGNRHYWEGSDQGYWPSLCMVLLGLHAEPNVKFVWYGGDEYMAPCPPLRVVQITCHFLGCSTSALPATSD